MKCPERLMHVLGDIGHFSYDTLRSPKYVMHHDSAKLILRGPCTIKIKYRCLQRTAKIGEVRSVKGLTNR